MAFTKKAFRDWGRIGGRMRARRLSKARLRQIAFRAARARTRKRKYGRTSWPTGRVNADHAETMFRDGFTLQSIGENFHVSRERVRQVLKKRGVLGRDGGVKVRSEKKRQQLARGVAERRAAMLLRVWGLTPEEYEAIAVQYGYASQKRSPFHRYRQQRRSAGTRKIKWEFTFPEWWEVWQSSGKWPVRGQGKGKFVMARPGDVGPYRSDNVEIIMGSQNNSDYMQRRNKARAGMTPQRVQQIVKAGNDG